MIIFAQNITKMSTYAEIRDRMAGLQLDKNEKDFIDNVNRAIQKQIRTGQVHVSDISQRMGCKTLWTRRKFKKVTGISVYQYILFRRLSHAIYLMQHTKGMTLDQVGKACSFADNAHLTHAFLRMLECTPQQFRQQLTKAK